MAALRCAAGEVLATLQLIYDSLVSTGDGYVANSHLLDVLRQVGRLQEGARGGWRGGGADRGAATSVCV